MMTWLGLCWVGLSWAQDPEADTGLLRLPVGPEAVVQTPPTAPVVEPAPAEPAVEPAVEPAPAEPAVEPSPGAPSVTSPAAPRPAAPPAPEPAPQVAAPQVAAPQVAAPQVAEPTGLPPLLPPAPAGGPSRGGLWLLAALVAVLVSGASERAAARLPTEGLLARVLTTAGGLGRVLGVLFALLAGLLLLPSAWSPAVPYVLVGAALALGWTLRDLLRDLLAGVVLLVEGRVRAGMRLSHEGRGGLVRYVGLRSTLMEDDSGLRLTLPNHLFLDQAVSIDQDAYAPVEVAVRVPPGAGAGHVRQILEELALLSPYLAPSRPPHVYRDPDRENLWIVEARLVHPRYARTFRGALVELADEVLRSPVPERPPEDSGA